MVYDLETPTNTLKLLAGPPPTVPPTSPAVYTGWHMGLESLARHLYDDHGWRGRLALYLLHTLTR